MKYASICCYYGQFPKYFNFWIESAKKNYSIDFFIVTDRESISPYKEILCNIDNIKILDIEFEKLKDKMQAFFDFNIVLDTPYKLCDYRLMFGLVFEKELEKYDYFGWFDIDTIQGDLNRLLLNPSVMSYDIIGINGHFTLLKNTRNLKTLFFKSVNKSNQASSYRKVFSTSISCFFDEDYGLRKLIREYKVLDLRPYIADISPMEYDFCCPIASGNCIIKRDTNNHKLFVCDETGEHEVLYAHFQKRKISVDNNIKDVYYIVPNRITNNNDYEIINKKNKDNIKKFNKDASRAKRIYLSTNLMQVLKNKIISLLKI